MDPSLVVGLILLAVGLAFAGLGAFISAAKGRSGWEGGTFGFILGPFGLLIAVLMPTVRSTPQQPPAKPSPPADGHEINLAAAAERYNHIPRKLYGEVPDAPKRLR